MNRLSAGLAAGFVATIVLSVLMVVKSKMGLMPDVNAIQMLTGMSNKMLGTPPNPAVGWVIHFLIGALLWGALFSALFDKLPAASAAVKGIVFSIGAWLLMMIGPMPMAGAGLFGLNIGIQAPVATLVLHIVFGGTLGAVFLRLYTADQPPVQAP